MHRRILSLALIGFLSIIIINWSCTKLDTTNLGSDLLPAVDNVNTFADTLLINTAQLDYIDTTNVLITDNHVIGITNDPLFGKTDASLYLQLKPPSFPFSFGPHDSLVGPNAGLDSVVLCLSYKGFYGDSMQPQQFHVYEIADNQFKDSTYNTKDYQPTTSNMIGTKTVDITTLDEYMKYAYIKDSVQYQVRIKLDAAYADKLFNSSSDSFSIGTGNHAFYNDSMYVEIFNGLAVKPVANGSMGNLLYINLADTNTKLEVHYRKRIAGGLVDTTYTSFKVQLSDIETSTTTSQASAVVNHIIRDRSSSPSQTPTADVLYLQSQPGTYATLSIPRLDTYKDTNRIIHRAELIIEQIPDNIFTDSIFNAPNYLYLDIKDTGTVAPGSLPKYKPIYTDLNPNAYYDPDNSIYFFPPSPGADFSYFGGFARRKTGPFGESMVYYNINISRYIQQLVKNHGTNYEMRLFPAYSIHYGQYSAYVPYSNSVAYGRTKVGSGSNPNYRMRLRIIYSKIK